jgi:hypothetical protein
MIKIVIGNKSDVEKHERRVDMRTGKAFAESRGLQFFETSAVLSDGSINDVFQKLATLIKQNFSEDELHSTV